MLRRFEALPGHFNFDPARCALLLIDMQRDFLEPGGFGAALGNDVTHLHRAIAPCAALLAAARAAGLLVIHTREGHRPDLSDCPPAKLTRAPPGLRIGDAGPMGRILVRGEAGHEIIPELAPLPGEVVLDKPGKGAFWATDLENILRNRGIEALLVGGVTTEVCVSTTIREANDRGFRCAAISEACASYFPEFHASALAMIHAQGGIFGWVASADAAIAALQEILSMSMTRTQLWTPGDWNALFGFGTNILVNLLVLTGLLRFVVGMPDAIVFGRILPAAGLMMFLSTGYYAWLGWKLMKETGRTDVCALPSGISVPHMFVVCLVIMLPIAQMTGDPIKGWEAGLTWVFVQSFVLILGAYAAPWIRRITPRAALLGTLAGVSVTFIAMRPALEMFMTPILGLICFAVILVAWFGGFRYPRNIPAGLVAIAFGLVIAWGSAAIGLGVGGVGLTALGASFGQLGFNIPIPALDHVFGGFQFIGIILVTAIPFGIYDLVEALDNVESAEAAGDHYPTTRVLTADGVVSLIGCCMGNPFINAVYIGHPGWKAMGGRIGYSAATGLAVLVFTWLGIASVLLALVPVVAIAPILLYIGMLIGAQAFQETPKGHAPAVVLALTPHLAAWAKTLIDGALGAAGTNAAAVGMDKLIGMGVLYPGLAVMGEGAILGGLILGAIAVFIIERDYVKASAFAAAGAIMTFFGLMHGPAVGFAVTPGLAFAYLMVAVFLMACARREGMAPAWVEAGIAAAKARIARKPMAGTPPAIPSE